MECSCSEASSYCSYSFSDGEKELFKSSFKIVVYRGTERIYKCAICGTVWHASLLHGGGIYGNVDWTNISLSHWHDHWYWKMNESS